MKRMTLEEFHAACKAQASSGELTTVKCPMCGTLQNGLDFIAAGAGKDWGDVARHVGVECVGRFTGGGSPRQDPDGKPCNWSLKGLLQTHRMVVATPDGKELPHFKLASRKEAAMRHAAQRSPEGAFALGASLARCWGVCL